MKKIGRVVAEKNHLQVSDHLQVSARHPARLQEATVASRVEAEALEAEEPAEIGEIRLYEGKNHGIC